MWWKKSSKEGKEKVVAYLRSRLFPWNFIFEDVEEASVEHFIPYALQMCEAKGIEKGSVGKEDVKRVVTQEVKEAVSDYLFEPEDKAMIRVHGREFAAIYPFAFSQGLAHAILYRLGLEWEDVVDIKAISDLLGQDIREIKRREFILKELISRNESKAMKMFAKSILDKRVITAGGEDIGNVEDLIFTDGTGKVGELIVTHARGSGLEKSRISMDDIRLNMYSKNVVLKSSNYHKE